MRKQVNIEDLIFILNKQKAAANTKIILEGSILSAKDEALLTSFEVPLSNQSSPYIEKSKMIQKITDGLLESTKVSWKEGNLNAWSSLARRMSMAIENAIPLLRLM